MIVNDLTKSFEIKLDAKGKTGEVSLSFNGMDVNMTRFPKRNERRQTNGKWIVQRFSQCTVEM